MNKFFTLLLLTACISCTGGKQSPFRKLNNEEEKFVRSIGLLNEGEEIILFHANGGFEKVNQSGNFFTNKRIATYFINPKDSLLSSKDFAFFSNIDSLHLIDRKGHFINNSEVCVFTSEPREFRILIDTDSLSVKEFYEAALAQWKKQK